MGGMKMWGRVINDRSFIVTQKEDSFVASYKDTPSYKTQFLGTFDSLDDAAEACAKHLKPVQ
jgi:hypothetical protein